MKSVLTIAGSDSLAGGGIQADLKAFEELNTFGFSAITSIASIYPNSVELDLIVESILDKQLDSIFSQVSIKALKTGLIGSVSGIKLVQKYLKTNRSLVVVDPVLVLKEGDLANSQAYIDVVKTDLLPLADVTTPNLTEAEQLSGVKISDIKDLPTAARKIQKLGCPNVVIKGGARLAGAEAVDYLLTPQNEYYLKTPRLQTKTVNGAGCTFSSAITALLANGESLLDAVKMAQSFTHKAIANGISIGSTSGSVYQGASRQGEWSYGKK